jgi:hypothetical protein
VRAVFPTPPSPSTTNLYSTILPAILAVVWADCVADVKFECRVLRVSDGGLRSAEVAPSLD